jgi:hypothetical protein
MGKLVVTEFISPDGVIEHPGGAEKYRHGEQLLGRVTYEGFAKAWPTIEGTGEFGEKMSAMPKFAVSTTLKHPEWDNTTVPLVETKQSGAVAILIFGRER